ncbi:MAG: hypothetical protein AAGA43_13395 [Bacteroidota bacterium]
MAVVKEIKQKLVANDSYNEKYVKHFIEKFQNERSNAGFFFFTTKSKLGRKIAALKYLLNNNLP